MFRDYSDPTQDPAFSDVVELDLSTVVPSLSGPKRPHDRVPVSGMKEDFQQCLDNKVGGAKHGNVVVQCTCLLPLIFPPSSPSPLSYVQVGFKGFHIPTEKQRDTVPFTFEGKKYSLTHGECPLLPPTRPPAVEPERTRA